MITQNAEKIKPQNKICNKNKEHVIKLLRPIIKHYLTKFIRLWKFPKITRI